MSSCERCLKFIWFQTHYPPSVYMLHQSMDLVSNKHLIAFFMNAENWMFLTFFRYKILLKIDTMHLNTKINSYMKPWKRQKCLIHQRPESPFADVDECTSGLHSCHKFASCTNTIGSYSCSCQQHFNGDGKNCQHPVSGEYCFYWSGLV